MLEFIICLTIKPFPVFSILAITGFEKSKPVLMANIRFKDQSGV